MRILLSHSKEAGATGFTVHDTVPKNHKKRVELGTVVFIQDLHTYTGGVGCRAAGLGARGYGARGWGLWGYVAKGYGVMGLWGYGAMELRATGYGAGG